MRTRRTVGKKSEMLKKALIAIALLTLLISVAGAYPHPIQNSGCGLKIHGDWSGTYTVDTKDLGSIGVILDIGLWIHIPDWK